jgi:hypothetical protein
MQQVDAIEDFLLECKFFRELKQANPTSTSEKLRLIGRCIIRERLLEGFER